MAKIKTSVIFKDYNPQQVLLLPPSLEELIAPKHLVRVVNQVVDSMDVSELINLYEGGGASAYHPRMLLKVLLYAYSVKIYTGRKMAKALTQDNAATAVIVCFIKAVANQRKVQIEPSE